jgi:hypothetical protein
VRTVDAFRALPMGGLETGGVLFGRVSPNARTPLRVEIVAERAIECAHSLGPAFQLDEGERNQLAILLDRSRVDPALAGLSVVGFWVSHPRTAMGLTPEDVELFNRFFPNPWQVALVLKPASGEPTRATFLYRTGGQLQPHNPREEFFVDPQSAADAPTTDTIEPPPTPPSAERRYQPISRERRLQMAQSTNSIFVPPPQEVRPDPALDWRSLLVGALIGLAVGGGATYYFSDYWIPNGQVKGHDPDINLELFAAGSDLLVHWNAKAVEIRSASRGELRIRDILGERVQNLDRAALTRGYLRIGATEAPVAVVMSVIQQNGVTERSQAFLQGH